MAIGSVTSGAAAARQLQQQAQAQAAHNAQTAGRNRHAEGGQQDRAQKAAATSGSSTNLQGQTIGTIINTSA